MKGCALIHALCQTRAPHKWRNHVAGLEQLHWLSIDTPTVHWQVTSDDKDARVAVTTRHCYSVQVAPGTDCVLMIAAAMAVEDLYTK